MEFNALPIITFLYIAVVVSSQAAPPPELYWKNILPNIDMPRAVKSSLPKPSIVFSVSQGPKKNLGNVGIHLGLIPFDYYYAASPAQLYDPIHTPFFLKKDMKHGIWMNLQFTESTNTATFLPREEVELLPFSSNKIPVIIQEFSIQPNSDEAKIFAETIERCELKGIQGEQKYCATSLESMVDYAIKTLGKNAKAISTEAKVVNNKVHKYIISAVEKVGENNETVVCHKQNYPYAVFYCHKTADTSAYMVSLMNVDGSKVRAVAICLYAIKIPALGTQNTWPSKFSMSSLEVFLFATFCLRITLFGFLTTPFLQSSPCKAWNIIFPARHILPQD